MKNISTLILILLSTHVFGQFVKGDKVLSGTLSLNVQHAPENPNSDLINKQTTFDVGPKFGALILNNLELGAQLAYSNSTSERNTTTPIIYDYKSTYWSAGFYLQRYFTISERFLFSLIGTATYGAGESSNTITNIDTSETSEAEITSNTLGISINPNFTFFPTTNWAIQASIGNISYSYRNNKTDDEKLHLFNATYGTIGLGVSYYFRKNND